MEILNDMNVLYEAYLRAMKSSAWKEEPQRFEIDFLSGLTALKHELETREYRPGEKRQFIINERGKTRIIRASSMRDRVVQHALCDAILDVELEKYLIYNNGASRKGKGISFTRRMFERDLHNYWLENRSNKGYVAFVDLSKFYDNIRHDKLLESLDGKLPEEALWLLERILESFQVDVSYMGDEQYGDCLNEKFDSLAYCATVKREQRTGEKRMAKSVNIGDQVSQGLGVFFPTSIDNYAKIVRGCKRYGRYMDDIYIIHESRDFLESMIAGIQERADALGLFINEKKTHIARIDEPFRYLQIKYMLSNTGRVVRRVSNQTVARARRRLKAYKRSGVSYGAVERAYKSWMGNYAPVMSRRQVESMQGLYKNLYGSGKKWKKK